MKALIVRGTTVSGKTVNPGDVVELDRETFHTLRGQGQAVAYAEPEAAPVVPIEPEQKPTKFKKRK